MPEPPPLVPGAPSAEDPGAPEFARLDGIVEGRVRDAAAVRAAAARTNAAGFARLELQLEGGRFTLLPDAGPVPPERMSDERRSAFLEGLTAVAAASAGPLESTLRCTEVFARSVRETLFHADAGGLRALTRERPATDSDRAAPADDDGDAVAPMSRPRMLVLAALLLLVAAIAAWSTGWVDRALSPPADRVQVDTGVFGRSVDVSVDTSWGDYRLTLRRGAGWPATMAEVEALQSAAATPAERAAATAIADGGEIWARVEDASGKGLGASRASLRPLLERADGKAEVRLPGFWSTRRIRLALDAGPEFR